MNWRDLDREELENPTGKHGGAHSLGKRKIARPLVIDRPMHLVYRASAARGPQSFLHEANRRKVAEILDQTAAKSEVQILGFQNMGNHFHILAHGKTLAGLRAFLRIFPQQVAIAITGACRGKPSGRFFDRLVFTRIVSWGTDLLRIREYFFKNALEALGYSKQEVIRMRAAAAAHPGNAHLYPWRKPIPASHAPASHAPASHAPASHAPASPR